MASGYLFFCPLFLVLRDMKLHCLLKTIVAVGPVLYFGILKDRWPQLSCEKRAKILLGPPVSDLWFWTFIIIDLSTTSNRAT